ncbi:hypothetical protein [Amycolatopsis sp. cmx-11-12]|uniref:hypothetical protein n=1 Tax=Amycolatopsis sp. cmx-11-12 TaxID=2785795 RepID=UPI003916D50A
MSDEKPGDTPPKPASKPETPTPRPSEEASASKASPSPPDAESYQSPSREEAMQRLRGEASELSAAKFGRIIAEGTNRLDGAVTVNVFEGEFSVEGDFFAGDGAGRGGRRSSGRRSGSVRLDPAKVAEENEYFVAPIGFEEGVDILSARSLLLLSGPARTGRRTRAFATLIEVMKRVEREPELIRLDGSVLGNTNWRVPKRGHGFVIIDRESRGGKFAAESVTDTWLQYAAEQLAEHESYLVVVTGPVRGQLATAPKRAEFVLEDLELPDSLEIVRRRVIGELLWDPGDLDRRLAETELEELLHERDNDPRFATRAAAVISEALRSEADLAEEVEKLSNLEEQVREWLERDPEHMEVAFVLATAVLEGASYLSVADAAVSLFRELSGVSSSATPRYLRQLLAERDWIECVGRPGDGEGAPMLRFKRPRLRPVVLALAWFEFDGARAKILEWLKKLAEHTDVEVRARAAQAAGILASNDFEHGVHQYFLPWAAAKSAPLRQSAANGLNVAGTLGQHAESAWTYVEQWADLVGSGEVRNNLLATVGLAVGGQLGVDEPRRALRVLRTLVRDGDWALLQPVAMSTQTLLDAGRDEEVLEAFLEWTDDSHDEEAVVKVLTMFAFAVAPEDGEDEQPLLMREADRHREALPELWGRALAAKPVRGLAMESLRSWVRTADTDKTARDTVLDVIAGIADRSATDYGRLLHALHEWALDADDPSDAAADFHDELLEAGEETP